MMRHVFAFSVMALSVSLLSASEDAEVKVEVKGPHICCKQCINVVGKILGKVDGVTAAKCDIKTKTITFNAKNDATAKAAVTALLDGGFFGSATAGGKDLKIDVPAGKKEKFDVVTIKDVHVCCGQCVTGVEKAFADVGAKTTCKGAGPQKTVTVEKAGLEQAAVLEALRKAGFNGTIVEGK